MKNNRKTYLLKNTAIFTFGSIGSRLIAFIMIPVYTKVLSTAEYGTVDLLTTICTVLAPILIMNIGESVMRFSLDKDANYAKVLSVGIVFYVIAMFVGLAIFPINRLFEVTSDYSGFIYFYTVSLAGSQLFLCYLRGREYLLAYTVGNLILAFATGLLNIVFLVYFKLGVPGFFLAYILSNCIVMIYAIIAGRVWSALKGFCFDKELMTKMIKYSAVLIPNTFMWWIMNSSDRIMVTAMVGIAANGVYAISYKLPTLISLATNIINQAWSYSAIKENGSKDEQDFNNKMLRMLISFTMLIGIGLLAIMKPFLCVYVHPDYYEAWQYTPFLIIGCVCMTFGTFFATSYTVHKDSIGYLISGSCGAMFNILLNFILIPLIGVYGAAIATCVSYIIVFIFRLFHTRKYIRYNIINREFIIGAILLLCASMFIYIDNNIGQVLQFVILFIAMIVYAENWIPLVGMLLKKERKPA